MVRRRRTDTAAARTVQTARSCRPRPAAQRYLRSRLSWRSNRLKRSVPRSRRSSCRGRGGFADAERPCGTAWHCQTPRGPPVGRRWPAGLPAVADPPAAATDPPDCQAVPAAGRPSAACAGRTALPADAAAASRQMIARASAAMQPLQLSTVRTADYPFRQPDDKGRV